MSAPAPSPRSSGIAPGSPVRCSTGSTSTSRSRQSGIRTWRSGRRGKRPSHIRERVKGARRIQHERFQGKRVFCNAQMTSRYLKRYCQIDQEGNRLLEHGHDKVRPERPGLHADLEGGPHHRRSGGEGGHRTAPPLRGHPVPDPGQGDLII